MGGMSRVLLTLLKNRVLLMGDSMGDGAYQEPLHLIINDGSYGGPGVTVLLNLSKTCQKYLRHSHAAGSC